MSSQLPADEPGEQSSAADDTHAGETHAERVARLFREHNEALLRFLQTRLHSRDEAKEVAQEAYVQMLGLHHPATVHFLQGYLFTTAANIATNRQIQRMRRRRNDELVFFEREDGRTPDRICAGDRDIELVNQALNELPVKCREAFRLVWLEEIGMDEVAQRLNLSPRQIRRHVARALAYCASKVKSATNQGDPS